MNQEGEWLREDIHRIEDKLDLLSQDVAALKVKASAWGFLAGLVPAVLSLIWQNLAGRKQ